MEMFFRLFPLYLAQDFKLILLFYIQYGKYIIGVIVMQVIGFIILIFVTCKRETIINDFLTDLMNSDKAESVNLMDTIQNYVSFFSFLFCTTDVVPRETTPSLNTFIVF